jgi:hypothetical protein
MDSRKSRKLFAFVLKGMLAEKETFLQLSGSGFHAEYSGGTEQLDIHGLKVLYRL